MIYFRTKKGKKGWKGKKKGKKGREKGKNGETRKIKESGGKGSKKISPATHTWNLQRGIEFNSKEIKPQ